MNGYIQEFCLFYDYHQIVIKFKEQFINEIIESKWYFRQMK